MVTQIRFIVIFYILLTLVSLNNGKIPIIGVVANTYPENDKIATNSVVYSEYVRWLEDGGSIVVPIFPWYNDNQLDELLSKINGVLWQGGMRDLILGGEFEDFNYKILQRVIKKLSNDMIHLKKNNTETNKKPQLFSSPP